MNDHFGICNVCLLNCSWTGAPSGGWWSHEWPNKLVETQVKTDRGHDADPGWMPAEYIDDDGFYRTVPTERAG